MPLDFKPLDYKQKGSVKAKPETKKVKRVMKKVGTTFDGVGNLDMLLKQISVGTNWYLTVIDKKVGSKNNFTVKGSYVIVESSIANELSPITDDFLEVLVDKCSEHIADNYDDDDRGDDELLDNLGLLKPEISYDDYIGNAHLAEAIDLLFAMDSFRPKEDGGYGLSLKYSPDRRAFIICVFSDYV